MNGGDESVGFSSRSWYHRRSKKVRLISFITIKCTREHAIANEERHEGQVAVSYRSYHRHVLRGSFWSSLRFESACGRQRNLRSKVFGMSRQGWPGDSKLARKRPAGFHGCEMAKIANGRPNRRLHQRGKREVHARFQEQTLR